MEKGMGKEVNTYIKEMKVANVGEEKIAGRDESREG